MGFRCIWFTGIVFLLVHRHNPSTTWGFMMQQPWVKQSTLFSSHKIRRHYGQGVHDDESENVMSLQHSTKKKPFLFREQAPSLGAPRTPEDRTFTTKGGVFVQSRVEPIPNPSEKVEKLINLLDNRLGILLHSSYEFPARYARWTVGFFDPPIMLTGKGNQFQVTALNDRGKVLLPAFLKAVTALRNKEKGLLVMIDDEAGVITGTMTRDPNAVFAEVDRSRQLSHFSIIRSIVDLFSCNDPQLGLYGAFGYDLGLQFEAIKHYHKRDPDQDDLVLYFPDRITVVDQEKRDSWGIYYDFSFNGNSTLGLPRSGREAQFEPYSALNREAGAPTLQCAHPKGRYSEQVRSLVFLLSLRHNLLSEINVQVERVREEFRVGNLFEAVMSQTFKEPCHLNPSEVFMTLCERNPSPYGFFMNLGKCDYLVGASPEMFVRCETTRDGLRIETCPISGTRPRGRDAMGDAAAVQELLFNPKEESELTMCTDVDRNDKSRICESGTVKVLNRRQIEMYSRVIHTVDHVEGFLRPEFDALDAFLCHTWAVTVTGAPKRWAMQYIEQHESSPRKWYGGAVGHVGFDGYLNTGLTLRTVHIKHGIAEVRAGATLLYDSVPMEEEKETELKASAMLDVLVRRDRQKSDIANTTKTYPRNLDRTVGHDKHVLLIDHEDSFVHTLGNYIQQTGANIMTVRCGPALDLIFNDMMKGVTKKYDLVVLSPGPGRPTDFSVSETLSKLEKVQIPTFGVCLGLQGMVEHWGGEIKVLPFPQHGKKSKVHVLNREMHKRGIFNLLPDTFEVRPLVL